jgi:hypothetical protein
MADAPPSLIQLDPTPLDSQGTASHGASHSYYHPGPNSPQPQPSTSYNPPLRPGGGGVTTTFAPPPVVPDAGPALVQSPVSIKTGIRATKSTAEFALREYMTLCRRRQKPGEVGIEDSLRAQAAVVVRSLAAVRQDVAGLVKAAERHRWRRWILGGIMLVSPTYFLPIFQKL